jgi:glycosyltransferase involved in cell wall biosynthesis
MLQFALTYAPDTFDMRLKKMGRQAAGLGFLKAVLNVKPDRLWCYAGSREQAEIFARDVRALNTATPEMRFIAWNEPERLVAAGLLYRPDPGLAREGWMRRQAAGARAYSLCGVTHTICSQRAMETISETFRAPLYPWDAIICTSTVARDVYRRILEAEMEHLRSRLGATQFTLPQLPLIPLGVHCRDFDVSVEARAAARARLGLSPDDAAVLFAGRLVFHGKAHPLPMFLGLQRAADRTGKSLTLVLFGTFPNAPVEDAFRKEAAQFAPSVRLVVLDGAKDEDRDAAWAAADIFTSLSDNVQETFGLTPVEAMAAGLPVVVSDWDGYKDTVRDGIDGFRVPTLLAPPGAGGDLIDHYSQPGPDTYDLYVGRVAQFTAVNVEATAEAYTRLVADPELRARMGAAGRERARSTFDWSTVIRSYIRLWDELAERRRADPSCPGEEVRARRADRLDPFDLFRTFPTRSLDGRLRIRRATGADLVTLAERYGLASVGFAHDAMMSRDGLVELLAAVPEEGCSVGDVAARLPRVSQVHLTRNLVWLSKVGLLAFDPKF